MKKERNACLIDLIEMIKTRSHGKIRLQGKRKNNM